VAREQDRKLNSTLPPQLANDTLPHINGPHMQC